MSDILHTTTNTIKNTNSSNTKLEWISNQTIGNINDDNNNDNNDDVDSVWIIVIVICLLICVIGIIFVIYALYGKKAQSRCKLSIHASHLRTGIKNIIKSNVTNGKKQETHMHANEGTRKQNKSLSQSEMSSMSEGQNIDDLFVQEHGHGISQTGYNKTSSPIKRGVTKNGAKDNVSSRSPTPGALETQILGR